MIVVTGASVFTSHGFEKTDVAIEAGVVADVGQIKVGDADIGIDGNGCWLGPGFVDIHVHLRDPGQTWKEDLTSGTRAAAAGGFTALVAMPNTEPPIDSAKVVRHIQRAAEQSTSAQVVVAGALTRERAGVEMADFDGLYDAGVRIFTDDGDSVGDAGLLRRAMTYLSDFPGAIVAQHAEDLSMTADGHLNEGMMSQLLGIKGLPAVAEEVVIARDLVLAAEIGIHYHAQHVSTRGSVELIRRAKESGMKVTAEVTPHHLTLSDQSCEGLDPNTKMYPPLRSPADVEVVREALAAGVIDIVATDHAPHSSVEKDVPFEQAPRGVIGLETAFPLVLAALSDDAEAVFRTMSVAPAAIAGLARHGKAIEKGSPANLVLVDPSARWEVKSFESRSSNSPFFGQSLRGAVVATIYDGELVARRER